MTWFNSLGTGSSPKILWIRLDCIKGGQFRDWSYVVFSLAAGKNCHAAYVSRHLPDKEWYRNPWGCGLRLAADDRRNVKRNDDDAK